jgi:uncharacterized protein YdhG (YjbR/CyaY superfamily)
MPSKPKSIDEVLAAVSPGQRAALEKLRQTIKAIVPDAEECVSYGLPAFRLNGKPLVAFGAGAHHCAFYPMSSATVAALADDLKKYETSKGTIRFPANKPLPASLVRKAIKSRLAEYGEKAGKPAAKPDPGVAEFLRELNHPLKKDIETVRKIILGVSPKIAEGIKWNSLSFRTAEYFATVNLRSRDRVQLVFHMGAKVKDNSTDGMQIADPRDLIRWIAKERCLVTVGAGKEIAGNRAALAAIVRKWISRM